MVNICEGVYAGESISKVCRIASSQYDFLSFEYVGKPTGRTYLRVRHYCEFRSIISWIHFSNVLLQIEGSSQFINFKKTIEKIEADGILYGVGITD